ncbi:MAG: YifB family Mg chelatase-like AAA ATPase [Varibaculum sp.]|nr:YifB family Mg chelatase-like AAA ATPase [Varibaculum sp.]
MSRVGIAKAIALSGIAGTLITVETHTSDSLPGITIVGHGDTSLREARERVRAALSSIQMPLGSTRYTINLSPADMPKMGSGFDVAIALSIVAGMVPSLCASLAETVVIGELGLTGEIRPVKGVLPRILAAHELGFRNAIVPRGNLSEAQLISGMRVSGYSHLAELLSDIGFAKYDDWPVPPSDTQFDSLPPQDDGVDLADVRGQEQAKWALQVAAAGGHHLLYIGDPGAGKTMLARRLPGILPQLTEAEAMESTAIHSLAGELRKPQLIRQAPFIAPHHSASQPSLVGGGAGLARPGAVSLAHNGVLFLDEAPEFSPRILDSLREPLESGEITIYRSAGAVTYPARFQLVLAANPCPCGKLNDCTCSPYIKQRYLSRLSGPLLDRIDITCPITVPSRGDLLADTDPLDTSKAAERVRNARQQAAQRYRDEAWNLNGQAPGKYLRGLLSPRLLSQLDDAVEKRVLSMRGAVKTMRLALTIADLRGATSPDGNDLGAAFNIHGEGL